MADGLPEGLSLTPPQPAGGGAPATPQGDSGLPAGLSATPPAPGGAPAGGTENWQWFGGPSAFETGLEHGLGNVFWGTGQLASHLTGIGQDWMDKHVAEREGRYQGQKQVQEHPYWSGAGDITGEIAGTAPLMLVPGGEATLPLRLLRGAAQGASAAGLTPVTGGDYWSEEGKKAAWGAAGGAAGEATAATVGRVIAPKVSQGVRYLANRGVTMTPGQLGAGGGTFGAIVRSAEEHLKSLPILGSFIKAGEQRSIEDFNIAAINQVLEPIGKSLPAGTKAGKNAIGVMQQTIDDEYSRVLDASGARLQSTPGLRNRIRSLQYLLRTTPDETQNTFNKIVTQHIERRFGTRPGPTGVTPAFGGSMDGRTLKQVESELTEKVKQYSGGSGADRELGKALGQLRQELRDEIERQNPQLAHDLQNVNKAYAMQARIEQAAGSRGSDTDNVFRPTDLDSAVRTQDPTKRHRAYARGDALMQDLASAAQQILPGKVPDSGTPARLAMLGGLLALGNFFMGHGIESDLVAGAGAAAGLSPFYMPSVQRGVQRYMLSGAGRQAAGKAVGDIGPMVDPAMGILTGGGSPMSYRWPSDQQTLPQYTPQAPME